MEIRFVKNERALKFGEFLIISDLHIGYKKSFEERGYKIPNQSKKFLKRIKELKEKTKTKKLIILGDVKHNIPYISENERYDLLRFFKGISELFEEVIITKGNHDGRIESLVRRENIKVVSEFVKDDIAFLHGHKYPSEKAMRCKFMVIGHTHPTFEIKEKTGVVHSYSCWVVGEFDKKKLKKKYEKIKCEKVIIVPAFNELMHGYKERVGPIAKAIKIKEIFLLDLTKVV